jgi:hypothetical protein
MVDVSAGALVVMAGGSLQEKKAKITHVEQGKYRYD